MQGIECQGKGEKRTKRTLTCYTHNSCPLSTHGSAPAGRAKVAAQKPHPSCCGAFDALRLAKKKATSPVGSSARDKSVKRGR